MTDILLEWDCWLHFSALNVPGGDVIENDVPTNIARGVLGREVLAALFEDDSQFQFVIELLGEMLGVDHRLILADDGVDILKKDDPRHNRMGESGLGGLLVMFPEISRGVEKLLRSNWRFEAYLRWGVGNRFTMDTGGADPSIENVVQGIARGVETGVATFEEGAHVRGYQRARQALKGLLAFVIFEIESARGIKVDDVAVISGYGADARHTRRIFERYELHESSRKNQTRRLCDEIRSSAIS